MLVGWLWQGIYIYTYIESMIRTAICDMVGMMDVVVVVLLSSEVISWWWFITSAISQADKISCVFITIDFGGIWIMIGLFCLFVMVFILYYSNNDGMTTNQLFFRSVSVEIVCLFAVIDSDDLRTYYSIALEHPPSCAIRSSKYPQSTYVYFLFYSSLE